MILNKPTSIKTLKLLYHALHRFRSDLKDPSVYEVERNCDVAVIFKELESNVINIQEKILKTLDEIKNSN